MSKPDSSIDKYTYRIEWSADGGVHIARCLEFPSLAAHGETPDSALQEIESVVAETVEWMQEEKETVPLPFGLRMPNCFAAGLRD